MFLVVVVLLSLGLGPLVLVIFLIPCLIPCLPKLNIFFNMFFSLFNSIPLVVGRWARLHNLVEVEPNLIA